MNWQPWQWQRMHRHIIFVVWACSWDWLASLVWAIVFCEFGLMLWAASEVEGVRGVGVALVAVAINIVLIVHER